MTNDRGRHGENKRLLLLLLSKSTNWRFAGTRKELDQIAALIIIIGGNVCVSFAEYLQLLQPLYDSEFLNGVLWSDGVPAAEAKHRGLHRDYAYQRQLQGLDLGRWCGKDGHHSVSFKPIIAVASTCLSRSEQLYTAQRDNKAGAVRSRCMPIGATICSIHQYWEYAGLKSKVVLWRHLWRHRKSPLLSLLPLEGELGLEVWLQLQG